MHDGGDPPREWLAPSKPTSDDTLRLDWLSDEVLEGVLFEARVAAGYSNRNLTRNWQTIQKDKRIIRLAANGHTNASIAELMSAFGAATTEGTIRNRRQRIRRLLEHLLPPDTFVEYNRSGGNQQRDPVGLSRPAKAGASALIASPLAPPPHSTETSPSRGLVSFSVIHFFYRTSHATLGADPAALLSDFIAFPTP